MRLGTTAILGMVAAAGVAGVPRSAEAYPIDCAILLCMAGGFPSSRECTQAKAEVIRRLAPPIPEPPLQLWRCPMGMDATTAASLGITPPALGPDGLTPEIRAYRDGIEMYWIKSYIRTPKTVKEDSYVYDDTYQGVYGPGGDFMFRDSKYETAPEWVGQAAGGDYVEATTCVKRPGKDNGCDEVTRMENRGGRRGVAFRFIDYSGKVHTEFVAY